MKYLRALSKVLLVTPLVTASLAASAASFIHEGVKVKSEVSDRSVDCGIYHVVLAEESFPFKYENYIPSEYYIKGFAGSPTIISKTAYIIPGNALIPQANKIKELEGQLLKGRTYLPGAVSCKAEKLIVSYWSGGNCTGCEAYVEFEIVDRLPLKPRKVNYSDYKAFIKPEEQ